MKSLSRTAWFYWDPPREAFTIPFFDHPIVWYGILFVSGFIIGYFVLIPILTRFLSQSKHLSNLDIANWPEFIEQLRSSSSPLITQLSTQFDLSTRRQIKQQSPAITSDLKQRILDGLNRLLRDSSISRADLEHTFGKALTSLKQTAYFLTDRLCWFTVIGTVVGARLGAVFFYDWNYFSSHPLEIFKVWHGGLASHGGFLGVMVSLYFYLKYIQKWVPQLTFLRLLDDVAIPTALVCCFIRLGNFMNQEILGTPTNLPWGILFAHPADDSLAIPRHPVQLYEAIAYLITFCILWSLWKYRNLDEEHPGALIGITFILGFGSRFILEYWKATQDSILDSSLLQMGQILSIPFILLGGYLLWRSRFIPLKRS